ncbi:TPA: ribosome biogenesis GTPase YlqF [Candidatus Galligastranaerophilus intestinavium]|uniref:Ribosome biogenesis GTPase A n=1 Tax=Candidatus Galligastranaerophilus intestinavium TaxID=2840836 RepID=A0A9D1FII1_9BACT|nr:ribosome biogenesis GTPase YlqF [Candidatus Galligastranaerophilus intestinavium]
MSHIHWFPGHIAKAQRDLKEKLNLVDVVLEVLDARIPHSSAYKNVQNLIGNKSRLILLNKSDLSDPKYNTLWAQKIEQESCAPVIITNLNNQKDINAIIEKIIEISNPIMLELLKKGLLPRAARTMVIGMPNVGKSSTINRLIRKGKTKTGAKAGVTRQQQWVRINNKVELLDTPGIIPTVQDDQKQAAKLACVNSIGENAYDNEFVARELLKLIQEAGYEELLRQYYKLDNEITIENIAQARNWIVKGAQPDVVRTSQFILTDFREGKIGKITLEKPAV